MEKIENPKRRMRRMESNVSLNNSKSSLLGVLLCLVITSSSAWCSPQPSCDHPLKMRRNHIGLKQSHQLKQRHLLASLSASRSDITASSSPKQYNRYRWSIFAVLAASFLNLLGFTMAGPITPALGKHFNLEVGASFGSLTSAYPMGMLLGLFLWPSLSDTLGRPPVITLSLLGTGAGLALQSYIIATHKPLQWFLASRILTGSFAGSAPVSKAYLADVASPNRTLSQLLAYRDAASTFAFLVGPLVGGIAYSTSSSLEKVIGISAAASLLAGAVVGVIVRSVPSKEDVKTEGDEPVSEIDENENETLLSCPLGTSLWAGVATVFAVSFLFNVGDSTFHAFFSALLKQNSLSASNIGLAYTALAAISFTVSTTLGATKMQKVGSVTRCTTGLTAVGIGLLVMGLCSTHLVPVILAAALYYCGVPLYSPSIPTMLLQCVPPNRRGFILGLDGIVNTIGRILAPLFIGNLYRMHGPKAAFGVAGGAALLAVVLASVKRIIVLRSS